MPRRCERPLSSGNLGVGPWPSSVIPQITSVLPVSRKDHPASRSSRNGLQQLIAYSFFFTLMPEKLNLDTFSLEATFFLPLSCRCSLHLSEGKDALSCLSLQARHKRTLLFSIVVIMLWLKINGAKKEVALEPGDTVRSLALFICLRLPQVHGNLFWRQQNGEILNSARMLWQNVRKHHKHLTS